MGEYKYIIFLKIHINPTKRENPIMRREHSPKNLQKIAINSESQKLEHVHHYILIYIL